MTHNVAVVGAGFIADYHLAAIREIPGLEVVGICDPNLERGRQLAEKWGVSSVYNSVDVLLNKQKVNVAHILTPPHLHIEVAQRFVEAGVSVFIEKPMGIDSGSCIELLERAVKMRVLVLVNHSALFHPGFLRLRQDIGAGKLGRVEHVTCVVHTPLRQITAREFGNWIFQNPVNILFEQAPHPFSQILTLMEFPQQIWPSVSGRHTLPGNQVFYDTWQIAMECRSSTANVLMVFGKEFPEAWVHVIGQDGWAHIDLLGNTYIIRQRTRYADPFDTWLGELQIAEARVFQTTCNLTAYALSVLRLRARADVFYQSIQSSIKSFYERLHPDMLRLPMVSDDWADGATVVEMCEIVGDRLSNKLEEDKAIANWSLGIEQILSGQAPGLGGNPQTAQHVAPPTEVLVLGATGFIGSHLVERLVREGYQVRIMVRHPASLPSCLCDLPLEVIIGDITAEKSVRQAVQGVKVVYHLASGQGQTWADFERLYVQGTWHVADACLKENVKRLIFTSTIAVYYLGNYRQIITEVTPLDDRPMGQNYYAWAKILCERLLGVWWGKYGLPVVIVRPGVVIGRRGRPDHSGVGWWSNATHCLGWGKGNNPLPFVLVEDVVDALVKAMAVEGIEGQSFNLVGDVLLSARDYVSCLREASRRDIRFHPRSLWRTQAAELIKWAVKEVARRDGNMSPSLRNLRSRQLLSRFDCSRAKEVLGWEPVSNRAEFLERGIGWIATKQETEQEDVPA